MKSILEYTDKFGNNCLMVSFQPMWQYNDRTDEDPTTSTGMFTEIEETILYLIKEGEKYGVDMKTILDTRNKSGSTIFSLATKYSENIALALLERDVTVNTIISKFNTCLLYTSDAADE